MTSKAEQILARELRGILKELNQGDKIEESAALRDVLSALEYYVTPILSEFQDWRHEGLDGIYLAKAHKLKVNEAELFGMCILITDQTLTPVHLQLKVADSEDKILWCRLRLGEKRPDGILKIPYSSSKWGKYLYQMNATSIDWCIDYSLGNRRIQKEG